VVWEPRQKSGAPDCAWGEGGTKVRERSEVGGCGWRGGANGGRVGGTGEELKDTPGLGDWDDLKSAERRMADQGE